MHSQFWTECNHHWFIWDIKPESRFAPFLGYCPSCFVTILEIVYLRKPPLSTSFLAQSQRGGHWPDWDELGYVSWARCNLVELSGGRSSWNCQHHLLCLSCSVLAEQKWDDIWKMGRGQGTCFRNPIDWKELRSWILGSHKTFPKREKSWQLCLIPCSLIILPQKPLSLSTC